MEEYENADCPPAETLCLPNLRFCFPTFPWRCLCSAPRPSLQQRLFAMRLRFSSDRHTPTLTALVCIDWTRRNSSLLWKCEVMFCSARRKKEIERKGKFLRPQCNTRQGTSIAVASIWKQNTRLDEGFCFRRSIARASQATRGARHPEPLRPLRAPGLSVPHAHDGVCCPR